MNSISWLNVRNKVKKYITISTVWQWPTQAGFSTVLPSGTLYHLVLITEMYEKLLFILCFTCAREKFNGGCKQDESGKCFTGTYVADELRVACFEGYNILKVYECLKYDDTYSKQNWVNRIHQHILENQNRGFRLPIMVLVWRVTTIKISSSLFSHTRRNQTWQISLAELMWNSHWGRIGQCDDTTQITKDVVHMRQQIPNVVRITKPAFEASSVYNC